MTILLQESGIHRDSPLYKSMIEIFVVCGGRDHSHGNMQTNYEYDEYDDDVQIIDSDIDIVDNDS